MASNSISPITKAQAQEKFQMLKVRAFVRACMRACSRDARRIIRRRLRV